MDCVTVGKLSLQSVDKTVDMHGGRRFEFPTCAEDTFTQTGRIQKPLVIQIAHVYRVPRDVPHVRDVQDEAAADVLLHAEAPVIDL